MNIHKRNLKFKEEKNKIFMMGISSLLLLFIAGFIIATSIKVNSYFSFTVPPQTFFLNTKGIEEYNLDNLKDKVDLIFSAHSKKELNVFIEKTVSLKDNFKLKKDFFSFFDKENLFRRNNEILNIVKIYGGFKEVKGNKRVFKTTNSKYSVSLKSLSFTDPKDVKYFSLQIITNDLQQIVSFEYYSNEELKEFFEALKIAKTLNLRNLPDYVSLKIKNKIAVRNLFIKPTGTYFNVISVEKNKSQNQIKVKIDKKIYILIYKNGEIINVIPIKNH